MIVITGEIILNQGRCFVYDDLNNAKIEMTILKEKWILWTYEQPMM